MKKLFTVCLVLVMVLSMNLTAFAAGFVSSPTNTPAPEVENPSDEVVVTPYPEREELDEEGQKDLEEAYDEILNSNDLSGIVEGLDDVADETDVPTGQIAASDLFNVTTTSGVKVVMKSDSLEHFVGLMVRVDGKWTLVDDARIENGRLVFTADVSGSYAILVNAGKYVKPPKTGEDNSIALYACGMAVSALAMVVLWKKAKAK